MLGVQLKLQRRCIPLRRTSVKSKVSVDVASLTTNPASQHKPLRVLRLSRSQNVLFLGGCVCDSCRMQKKKISNLLPVWKARPRWSNIFHNLPDNGIVVLKVDLLFFGLYLTVMRGSKLRPATMPSIIQSAGTNLPRLLCLVLAPTFASKDIYRLHLQAPKDTSYYMDIITQSKVISNISRVLYVTGLFTHY